MKQFISRYPDALIRVLVVFGLVIGGVLIIRSLLPPHLKNTAIHIQMTVDSEKVKPVKYAGSSVCGDCHEEANIKKGGYHKNLSCETCHGPAQAHAENPDEKKPQAPRKREFCEHCHTYDHSRPTGFPQINPVAHNPLKPCILCHNPHDPKPPMTPGECSACHAEIARTKAVSPHVLLECTTCHITPENHKITPRVVKASIPSEREFCGKCHTKESQVKETPKIDLATHGEKYLCWQCHYPHMPELD